MAVAVAAKGTLVAGVVAAETVADVGAVHHGYFQEGNHGSNEQEGVALW